MDGLFLFYLKRPRPDSIYVFRIRVVDKTNVVWVGAFESTMLRIVFVLYRRSVIAEKIRNISFSELTIGDRPYDSPKASELPP